MSDLGATTAEDLLKGLRENVIGRPLDGHGGITSVAHLEAHRYQLLPGETLYFSIGVDSCLTVGTLTSLTSLREEASRRNQMVYAFGLSPAEHHFAQSVLNSSGFYLLGTHSPGKPGVFTALAEDTTPEAALAAMGAVVDESPEGPNGFVVARLEPVADGFLVLDWRPVAVSGDTYVTIDPPIGAPTHVTFSALES
jgi:hypothetical protein